MANPVETIVWHTNVLKLKLGDRTVTPTMVMRLYVNDVTGTATSVIADFTECTLAGYGPASVPVGASVYSTFLTAAKVVLPDLTFHFTGPGLPATTIYGWYMVDTAIAPNYLIMSKRADAPFAVPPGGGDYKVSLTITQAQG